MNHTQRRSFPFLALAPLILLTGTVSSRASTQEAHALRTMQQDLASRSPEIHWPAGFEPHSADLFAHNEQVILAPCHTVFARIIAATSWPKWYPNSAAVQVLGSSRELGPGTRFRWTTFGLEIESQVHEFVADERIGWYGYTPGQAPAFYHTWLLRSVPNGCLTVMEEVGKGAAPEHLRKTDESLMHRGHELWLATLKWMSESE